MTEIYYYSPSAHYLRPTYPIDFGRPHKATRTLFSDTAPAFADGFVWLLKVLFNRKSRQLDKRVGSETSADAAQRRTNRLLREVPAALEAQARPTAK